MSMPQIQIATASDEPAAIDLLALAFSSDPAARWAWPDPGQYAKNFPAFARAFGGKAFSHSGAHCLEGNSGAALWLPPGVQPDLEAMTRLIQCAMPEERRQEFFALFEQMGSHHPSEPHWHLALIGVDPFHQGKGLGSVLMQQGLAACDRNRQLAYLESSNPKNISFYQRHGFEAQGAVQAGTSPKMVPMLRVPR
jgi:ribosomal protein S18 acetylase RimI-like enzyme